MITWAIIPVKPLRESKSRLASVLPAGGRAKLTRDNLRHILSILDETPVINRTLVVSRDPAVLKIARGLNASTYIETERQDLNIALTRAAHIASARYAECVLILPSDLPLIEPEDVELMLAAIEPPRKSDNGNGSHVPMSRSMAICTDHRQDGTNALALCPPAGFEFQFGPGSFERHLKEAQRLGMARRIVHAPGIKFDLDTEEDWRTLQIVRPTSAAGQLV